MSSQTTTTDKQLIADLEMALDPRRWNKAMQDAWHQNIPDVQRAFEALREAAYNVQHI